MRHVARALLAFILVFLAPLAGHALWWLDAGRPRAELVAGRLVERQAPAAAGRRRRRRSCAIYAARTGRWRGIFAHHSWIVVKEADARRYTRYDKVGWGSPVRTDGWPADGRWFGNRAGGRSSPSTARRPSGSCPKIRAAVQDYPYRAFGDYRVWPGPNSNTFVAHVLEAVPELGAALPPTAIGKDWQPRDRWLGWTPSRTGVRVSLGGLAGVTRRLGRGARGQRAQPRRRPRHPPPGAEAARLGADRDGRRSRDGSPPRPPRPR